MHRRFFSVVLVAALVAVFGAACNPLTSRQPAGPITKASKRPAPSVVSPGETPAIGALPGGGLITNGGGNLVTNGGNNIISHNGAGAVATTIGGRVTAPSTLLSNNGAGAISAGSGNYRALQAGETAYGGAKVFLLDAAAKPILGKDGQPAYALTDAQGRYGFTGALPEASNYLLAVQLPGEKGQLGAIAPSGPTRTADVSLVSTLTTGYIVSQYVRGQADPQATLDKLPATVEAVTRERATAALAGGTVAVPEALTTDRVVETVTALREALPAFDDQMEDVRRLLVAAGQLNLGEGQPALEVALPLIRGLMPTADGGLLINCNIIGRLFRVDATGRLTTAAGSTGAVETGSLTGLAADKAGLMPLAGMALDSGGKLLVLEQRRLSRKEADGKLTELWPASTEALVAVGRGPGSDLYVVSAVGLYQVTAAGVRTLKHPFTTAEAGFVKRVVTFGQDADGRLYLYTGPAAGAPAGEVRRLVPGTATLTSWVAPDTADLRGLAVDPDGRVYLEGQDGAVRLKSPAGTEAPLRGASLGLKAVRGSLAMRPDGTLYWATLGQVYKVETGAKALVAGTAGASVDAGGRIALNGPSGMLVQPDGALLISAFSDHQVLRVKDQDVSPFAGNGEIGTTGDGGPATAAAMSLPTALRRDGQGNLYVLQGGLTIRRIAPDGTISTVRSIPTDRRIYDFAVSMDGKTLYLTGATLGEVNGVANKPNSGYVERVATAGGEATPIYTGVQGEPVVLHVIALDATDRLHVMGSGMLRRWADGVFTEVKSDPSLTASLSWAGLARATFDAQGRFYYFTGAKAAQLNRLDLGTGAVTAVAGTGGKLLVGESVDESIQNGMSPVFNAAGICTSATGTTTRSRSCRLESSDTVIGV
jgi:hypothetical protein